MCAILDCLGDWDFGNSLGGVLSGRVAKGTGEYFPLRRRHAVGEPTGGRCYFCFRRPFATQIDLTKSV